MRPDRLLQAKKGRSKACFAPALLEIDLRPASGKGSSAGTISVVLAVELKEALGVPAGGTHLRGGGAHHDVAAVAALPHLDLTLLEDLSRLHVVEQRPVALLVALLDGGHQAEFGGQLREALRLSGLGEAVIHVGPLIVLALGGVLQVLGGVPQAAQLLEPQLGVGLLIFGGLQEEGGDLLIALVLGYGGEIGVLEPGLGLPRKGGRQVLLGLGAGVLARASGGRLLQLLKGGGGLLADRTGEVLRQILALIDIAANLTLPLAHVFLILSCHDAVLAGGHPLWGPG